MLSKKMAFSLTSLITIFALAFVAPSAMAVDFKVTIDGAKVATHASDATLTNPLPAILLTVTSEEALPEPLVTIDADGPDADATGANDAAGILTITTRDIRGFETSGSPSTADAAGGTPAGIGGVTVVDDPVATFTARSVKLRQLRVVITPGTPNTLERVTITIPGFETPDARVGDNDDWSPGASHTILIRDVADVMLDADDAKVVSIQRLRPGSQTASSGVPR